MRALRILPILGVALLSACGGSPEPIDAQASPYWNEADRMVDLDGQTVRYRTSGPEDAPTVVMLHGFTDSLHTWDALVATLEDDFRVIRPDLPGHGLSGPAPDGDYSNAALVTFVQDFIEATTDEAPILVGNSLGGLAAWRAAAENPEIVSGLVLLAPGGIPHNGVGDDPVNVPAMLKLYLKTAPEAGVRTALKAMHANPDIVTDEQVSQYRDLMRGQGNAFTARAAQFTLPDPVADMSRISVPTEIIWGLEDTVLPPDHGGMFAQNIQNANLSLLYSTGHLPHIEATDDVESTIRFMTLEITNFSTVGNNGVDQETQ